MFDLPRTFNDPVRRAVALLTGLMLCVTAMPAGAQGSKRNDIDVMLTKEQALEHVFADADEVLEMRVILDPDTANRIGALARRSLDEGGFYVYRARRAGTVVSYAVVVSQIGKVRPITHIVEVMPDRTVGDLAVMIYRETHGDEVADPRFCEQFRGKSLDDAIRIESDIINIAGSTLSGHALCRGARKALATATVLFIDSPPDQVAELIAHGTDVTPPSLAARAVPVVPADIIERSADGLRVRVERSVMGARCSVELHGGDGTPTHDALQDAAVAALDEISRWDDVLSDWRDDTPLARFNHAGAGSVQAAAPDLIAWLEHARWAHQVSDGAFDPTVGSIVSAWGLRTSSPGRPSASAHSAAFDASGLFHIEFDLEAGTLVRTHRRTRLDPGGSGKGWALDRAAEVLAGRGVQRGLLSFGSTLLALGPPTGADGWVVPVIHDAADTEVARVTLERGALSVSGGGFSTFDDGGTERGHVIDPRNGIPVPAARLAWVLRDSAADADALSTALLVAGDELTPLAGAHGVYLNAPGEEPLRWSSDD